MLNVMLRTEANPSHEISDVYLFALLKTICVDKIALALPSCELETSIRWIFCSNKFLRNFSERRRQFVARKKFFLMFLFRFHGDLKRNIQRRKGKFACWWLSLLSFSHFSIEFPVEIRSIVVNSSFNRNFHLIPGRKTNIFRLSASFSFWC